MVWESEGLSVGTCEETSGWIQSQMGASIYTRYFTIPPLILSPCPWANLFPRNGSYTHVSPIWDFAVKAFQWDVGLASIANSRHFPLGIPILRMYTSQASGQVNTTGPSPNPIVSLPTLQGMRLSGQGWHQRISLWGCVASSGHRVAIRGSLSMHLQLR